MARETAQQRAQIFPRRLRGNSAAARRVPRAAASRPRQAADRRGLRPAAPRAPMPRSRASADSRSMPYCPPIEPAEQPHHDHLGVRADAIDPQIDRHRMAQLAQVREAHARQPSRSASHAAASPERSLSANDSTAMSPGGWPRSTASTMSSSVLELVVSRCMPSHPSSGARHRGAIDALQSDHHEPAVTRLGRTPRPVEMMRDAGADRLHQQAQRLAGDRRQNP